MGPVVVTVAAVMGDRLGKGADIGSLVLDPFRIGDGHLLTALTQLTTHYSPVP